MFIVPSMSYIFRMFNAWWDYHTLAEMPLHEEGSKANSENAAVHNALSLRQLLINLLSHDTNEVKRSW